MISTENLLTLLTSGSVNYLYAILVSYFLQHHDSPLNTSLEIKRVSIGCVRRDEQPSHQHLLL